MIQEAEIGATLRSRSQRKLTYEDACAIRALHDAGVMSMRELSERYDLHYTAIQKIVTRQTYNAPILTIALPVIEREPYWPKWYEPGDPDEDVHAMARRFEIRTSYDHTHHPEYIAQAADARRRWAAAERAALPVAGDTERAA